MHEIIIKETTLDYVALVFSGANTEAFLHGRV